MTGKAGQLPEPRGAALLSGVALQRASHTPRAGLVPAAPALPGTPVAARAVQGNPFGMPAPYRDGFADDLDDDFDDTDQVRPGESGDLTVDGALAWRSRDRHPRGEAIDRVEPITMDTRHAGAGEKALGINPLFVRG